MRNSLFEDKKEIKNLGDLKLKCRLLYIDYKDIKFSPLSQILCGNCGMWGRTYRCPPHNMKYPKIKEYLKQFNKFILIVAESNKEEILKRYEHERSHFGLGIWKSQFYAGTQASAINLKKSKDDLKTLISFIKSRSEKYIGFGSAGCIKCRKCGIHEHTPCKYPHDSFSSPESVGIDLISTLRNKGIEVESPPIFRYISCCMIVFKE